MKIVLIPCIRWYAIYDSFNGSGTTGVACKMFNNGNNSLEYIGSEIS